METLYEQVEPLGEKLEAFYPPDGGYFDLKDAKFLRVNAFSDVMLKIMIEFSHNGVDKGIVTSQRSSSLWLSTKHEIPMRYVRLHVINESQQPNKALVIDIRLSYPCPHVEKKESKKVEFKAPIVEPEEVSRAFSIENIVPVVEEKERGKSPFNRFRKKSGVTGVKSVPMRDSRIPDFIPQGSIVIGGVGNTCKVLPKGVDGEYLMMKDGEPHWVLPFPPNHLSTDSKRLLSDGSWKI